MQGDGDVLLQIESWNDETVSIDYFPEECLLVGVDKTDNKGVLQVIVLEIVTEGQVWN